MAEEQQPGDISDHHRVLSASIEEARSARSEISQSKELLAACRLECADLEESLLLFEEGVRLSRVSQARLNSAEKRIEELLAIDENGQPVVRELDPSGS